MMCLNMLIPGISVGLQSICVNDVNAQSISITQSGQYIHIPGRFSVGFQDDIMGPVSIILFVCNC